MLIAQITDLHMRTPGDKAYGIIDPAAFLGPAVRALNALLAKISRVSAERRGPTAC